MAVVLGVNEMIAKLISFDTVSRNSNLALIHWVRDYLQSHGIASRLVASDDGSKANLYATVGPAVEGGVVLSGHSDVVPVDGQPWDSDPFQVVERDGKLFGRGTCDMKSFSAIALALVPEMQQLKRPIHIVLTYDEEVGCLGAPSLIDEILRELPRPRAVIVGEPTDMKTVTEHKGAVMLKTTVTGHEAHSSQTHRGVSAVMTAAKLVTRISEMAERQAAGPVDADVEPGYTTIHVGVINGGTALNIISRHCEFVWDVRHLPGDDPQQILDEFQHYCAELLPAMRAVAPAADIRTEVGLRAPAFRHQADSAAVELVKSLSGQNATYKVPYLTEAGLFQRAELSTVVCGPGSIDQAHQPNEYITLDQVQKGTAFTRRLIAHLSA